MCDLSGYIKDYGDGSLKLIKQGRSNLISGIIGLLFFVALGLITYILTEELGAIYFVSPFCLLFILIVRNNLKKVIKGMSMRLDDNTIQRAEMFLRDYLSKSISREVLLDYLDATLIEYFTMHPIDVNSRYLEQKISDVINNKIEITAFHDWIDIIWFLDIFELNSDIYYKVEGIENYKLEGENIPLRELKEMLH